MTEGTPLFEREGLEALARPFGVMSPLREEYESDMEVKDKGEGGEEGQRIHSKPHEKRNEKRANVCPPLAALIADKPASVQTPAVHFRGHYYSNYCI
jgi:hypothetical protein